MSDTDALSANGHGPRTLPTAPDLLQRCQTLLAELEEFKEYLKGRRQDHQVEIAHFRNTVKSEHRTLQRLADQNDADATQHTVNSSNLPFLETVWNTVKNLRGLQAIQKRFYWVDEKNKAKGSNNKRQSSALVDVVTEDGLRWIKVSLLTNTRLLFDKAKQGWEDASSNEDSDSDTDNADAKAQKKNDDDEDNDVPLVKMTKDLVRAASEVRIRTRTPRITLVLPKIHENQVNEIDNILASLRAMGVEILTFTSSLPAVDFDQVKPHLLTDPFASLTSTLNIDCTILLALVSDFSHSAVEAEPWFHRALKRQVEIEDAENLLPNLLYPALANKQLICTDAAAKRMREIVETIGTPGEKIRTELFMSGSSLSAEAIREELAKHSRFPVPGSLTLPIKTQVPHLSVNNKLPDASSKDQTPEPPFDQQISNLQISTQVPDLLPPSAAQVKDALTAINQSVFLHGWAKGFTTITSNRTVVKQIESVLSKVAVDEKEWPKIWLCPTARSLVGKEKGRKE